MLDRVPGAHRFRLPHGAFSKGLIKWVQRVAQFSAWGSVLGRWGPSCSCGLECRNSHWTGDLQVAPRRVNSGSVAFNGALSSGGLGAVLLMFGAWLVSCACLVPPQRVGVLIVFLFCLFMTALAFALHTSSCVVYVHWFSPMSFPCSFRF